VKVLHRKKIAEADHPHKIRKELTESYREQFASPFLAAAEGHIDDIISPDESRKRIIQALHMLQDKRSPTPDRKHGNIPL
jgi:acetyl-CoA carboxylase carboxyltransferase component